jgi:predicted dehydrogenase
VNRILIVGAGNIGSRHLQSMAKSNLPFEITVLDPSDQALDLSKRRFDEVAKQGNIGKPKYCESLDQVGLDFEVGIVATNSDVRRRVIEDLLRKTNVKYLIIEKVAFQNSSDFEHVIKLLKSRNVKTWVNLPRRVVSFYKQLKGKVTPHEQMFCTVQGGEWGLACNAIHFIDLLCFLTEETDYEVSCENLDKRLNDSKRKGFVEFTGYLRCHFHNSSELNLVSLNGSSSPPLVTIMTKSALCVVEEEKGLARISREEGDWEWEEIEFKWPYQSELTHKVVEEIIATGNCGLPSIEESYLIHKPLVNSFMSHLEGITGKKYSSCPIT